MTNSIAMYACPDCGRDFMAGQRHQHENGEWVETDELRRWMQWRRWSRLADKADIDSE